MRRFSTNPLDDAPHDKMTFDDVTLLAFMGVVALVVLGVLLLGTNCAVHRIEAALVLL